MRARWTSIRDRVQELIDPIINAMSQISFPPQVLARIAPEISLQRHLAIGLRPNLRNFTEFRNIHISDSPQSPLDSETNSNVIASSVAKAGNTTVINTFTIGISETNSSDEYASVYPVVEIARGRSGEPADEEQILSQQLNEAIYHAKLIPNGSLNIRCGLHVDQNSVVYPDTNPDEYTLASEAASIVPSKKLQYVLLVHCKVLSRQASTSALFDLLYEGIVHTLLKVLLPRVYMELSLNAKISVRSRSSGKRGMIGAAANNYSLDMLVNNRIPLELAGSSGLAACAGHSSNFGVISLHNQPEPRLVLLCDIEGEAEESAVLLRILITANDKGILRKVSLAADQALPISLECLRTAVDIAKLRSLNWDETA